MSESGAEWTRLVCSKPLDRKVSLLETLCWLEDDLYGDSQALSSAMEIYVGSTA